MFIYINFMALYLYAFSDLAVNFLLFLNLF